MSYSTWKKIPLLENCTKFIDVEVGECFLLCLIEDIEWNNKLYAKGKNDFNQCGVSSKEKNIRQLIICENSQKMNFKKIFTRNREAAAITVNGNLYMINMYEGQPLTLVLFNEKKEKNEKNKIMVMIKMN